MDYTLSDVAKMQSPDLTLDEVLKMPGRAAIKNKIDNDPISMGAKNMAQDMSASDQFFSGAGKAVSDLGRGVRQLYAGAADAISPQSPTLSSLVTGQRPSRSAAIQSEIDEAKRLDSPLMDTGGGLAGNVAGNVAMTLLPAGGIARGAEALNMGRTALAARAFINPATYTGAVASGAALGTLQPVASDESRLAHAALGGVAGGAGQAAVNTLGRIAQPVKNALDPVRQKAVDLLREAGVPLDLAQLTGSPAWGRIRSSLNDNLFTMGGQAAKEEEQKAALNKAILGTIGESAPAATSDVMGAAQKRINGVFGDVLDRNNVSAQPSWIAPLADVHTQALENEKQPVANIVRRIFDSIDPKTGEIPGQVAYGIKKDLDRMSMSGDSTQNYLARQAKKALMDGINGSLSGADQQAFAQARGQAANMYKLEPAIAKDGSGNISPSLLANVMGQKANRSASIYGNGPQELVDLAQSGKMILGDKTPNSGTAARMMAMTALPGMAIGGADAIHEYMQPEGDVLSALKHGASVAGGVIAAPKAAQAILNSPRIAGLLADGVTNPTLRGLLEGPQTNVIAGQAVRSLPALGTRALLLPANATYAQYLAAFDKAPDKATKLALGAEYEAQQSKASQ